LLRFIKKCFKIKVIISKVKKLLAILLEKTRLLENLQKIDEFFKKRYEKRRKIGKIKMIVSVLLFVSVLKENQFFK
jgi:hypothetical protein